MNVKEAAEYLRNSSEYDTYVKTRKLLEDTLSKNLAMIILSNSNYTIAQWEADSLATTAVDDVVNGWAYDRIREAYFV